MSDFRFKIHKEAMLRDGLIGELSADEARILLAIIATGGVFDKADIQELTGAAAARVVSSIALFTEAGILSDFDEARVTEEFTETKIESDEVLSDSGKLADIIRDRELASLPEEFRLLTGKGTLRPIEVSQITDLVSKQELSAEYVALYMSHLERMGRLKSASALRSGAIALKEKGICDVEALTKYIENVESTSRVMSEIKAALGIYRQLAPSESAFIKKWTEELSYSLPVISLAYDITVLNTGKLSFKYMDKLISDWHSADCHTVDDCEKRYNGRSRELAKSATARGRGEEKPKLKYGDFDPEEALKNAIRNSGFFDDEDDE
ncbi:MAG: DnaD domain protein [Clostridia bacterium]|nr:DnaD domain protein [Clostridia bacterium]